MRRRRNGGVGQLILGKAGESADGSFMTSEAGLRCVHFKALHHPDKRPIELKNVFGLTSIFFLRRVVSELPMFHTSVGVIPIQRGASGVPDTGLWSN